MVVGKVPGGGDLIVGSGDGGHDLTAADPADGVANEALPGLEEPKVTEMGFGGHKNEALVDRKYGERIAGEGILGPSGQDPSGKY